MIAKENIKDIYSLSPMQEGMLFHYVYDKKSTAYFEQLILKINGKIDVECMQKAFNLLIAKYDIFRTVFSYGAAKPRQVVLKQRDTSVFFQDLVSMNDSERERFYKTYKAADLNQQFDLSKDMLMRMGILQTQSNKYELFFSFHHILMDGWCVSMLFGDLFQFYGYLVNGGTIPHDLLKEQYPFNQYVKWLEKQDKTNAQKYWAQYLQDFEKKTTLSKAKIKLTDFN
jgi:NRPS condensation-like uncharacterized protein